MWFSKMLDFGLKFISVSVFVCDMLCDMVYMLLRSESENKVTSNNVLYNDSFFFSSRRGPVRVSSDKRHGVNTVK